MATKVAFLWDAAGKQDLFVVTPGSAPMALTDFRGRPRPAAIGHRRVRLGLERRDPLRQGRPAVDAWRRAAAKATRVAGALGDAGAFALSPDRKQIAFVRRGQLWIGIGRRRDRAAADQPARRSRPGRAGVLSRRPLAGVHRVRGGLEPEDLPWNGALVRSMETVTRERRLGIVAAQGGDVAWVPTVGRDERRAVRRRRRARLPGAVARRQDARDQDGARRAALPRVLWRDRDEKWWSPTNRDVKLLVSPDGSQLAFVSDRSGWIHVYVDAGGRHVGVAGEAADDRQLRRRARQLVARQPAPRLSPQRRRQPDGALRRRRRRGHRPERRRS